MFRVLDLFSGTGSVAKYCKQHADIYDDVVSVDVLPKCKATITCDVMKLNYKYLWKPHEFDIVWASPPCTHYSVARTSASTPRDIEGSNALVQRTLDIIDYLKPKAWFMENPKTGLLKQQPLVEGIPYVDVTYCMYGFDYYKPTRIWTNRKDFEARYCTAKAECGRKVRGLEGPTSWTHRLNICGKRTTSQNRKFSLPPQLLEELFSMDTSRSPAPQTAPPSTGACPSASSSARAAEG